MLSQAIHILMEATPPGIDLEAVREAVEVLAEVDDIHHVHV